MTRAADAMPEAAVPRPWRSIELTAADAADVRALFAQVFNAPMSDALWQWKYAAGRGCAFGVRGPDGALVAHYGGTARTLCMDSRSVRAVQMGDVMVRHDARGVLSRNGPFALATRHFIARHVGGAEPGAEGAFELGFGFPSARHARLGELLGLYRALGAVRELRWRAKPLHGWAAYRWQWQPQEPAAVDWGRVDALWQHMRAALPGWVVPQRDAPWCRHRYASHPEHRYGMGWLRCRFTRRKLGLMVIKWPGTPTAPAAGDTWEWMDWIGDPAHLPLALAVARGAAAQRGAGWLQGWFSQPVANRMLSEAARFSLSDTAHDQVVCSWCTTAARASTVPDDADGAPWWLTSGDTDFR